MNAFTYPTAKLEKKDTEYEALKNAGLELVGKFAQRERTKKLPNAADLGEGICEGQCLHWIRRVLQEGRLDYDASCDARQTTAAANVHRLAKAEGNDYPKRWGDFAQKADLVLAKAKGNAVKRQFANIEVCKHVPST